MNEEHKPNGLKPCPFCGNSVEVWPDSGFGVVKVIECKSCKIRFVFPWYQQSVELAKVWNRRVTDGTKRTILER